MSLNLVQVAHVTNAVRPQLEEVIKAVYILDAFVADHDALQGSSDALPTDTTVLDDAPDGSAPRVDAPALTGAQVLALRNICANMSAQLDASTKETLISKMVRPLVTVVSIG